MIRRALAVLSLVFVAGCGFSIATPGVDRRTPLEKAAQEGNLGEVQHLLAAGVNPSDKANPGACPLCLATLRSGNAEVVRALLAAGADPNGNVRDSIQLHGLTCWYPPVQQALYLGDLESARILLDAGGSMESPCARIAIAGLKPAVLDFLVERGFNLQAVDLGGLNYLHHALAPPLVPPPETIEYLVRAGVPLNARDNTGKTPLAFWREPRYYEQHWFLTWLGGHVFGIAEWVRDRDLRARISAFLDRSGAVL